MSRGIWKLCPLMEQAQTQPQAQPHPSADWISFLAWLEVNKQRVIWGAGLGLLLIAMVSLYSWYSNEKEATASRELSKVQMPFGAGEALPQVTLEGLRKVAKSYAGTKAATRAELEMAAAYYTQGNYADALKQFEGFLRDHPDSPWLNSAYFGIAACLDAEKKNEEALKKYGDFIVRYPNDPLADQARLNQGLIYEQTQKFDKAAELYDRMTKMPGYSSAAREADGRLRQIYADHPNLVPTNAPAAKPTAPFVSGTNRPSLISRIGTNQPARSNAPAIRLSPATNSAPAIRLNPAPAAGTPPAAKK